MAMENPPLPVSRVQASISLPQLITAIFLSTICLILGILLGYLITNQAKSTVAPAKQPMTFNPVDPGLFDIYKFKPAAMRLTKKIYLDFDGDGQKEIVLIGTDKEHTAGAQAGNPIEMPLIDVYKYSPVDKSWNNIAEMNYQNFPNQTNGSTLNQIIIVALGNKEALITTSFVSGSRVNARFQAIAKNYDSKKITVYSFPEEEYKSKGGQVPHEVSVDVEGAIFLNEGLYKPADSNNNPTNGTLKTMYLLDDSGVHFVRSDKLPFNLTVR